MQQVIVSSEILSEFKNRMHILHNFEDENLHNFISSSYMILVNQCGYFDINLNGLGKELVFERSRYLYNNCIELFDKNFNFQLNQLMIELAVAGDEDE